MGQIREKNIPRIIKNGRVCTLTRSRKDHTCEVCKETIKAREAYWSCVKGGGGMTWLKYPDRVCTQDIETYLRRCESNSI